MSSKLKRRPYCTLYIVHIIQLKKKLEGKENYLTGARLPLKTNSEQFWLKRRETAPGATKREGAGANICPIDKIERGA